MGREGHSDILKKWPRLRFLLPSQTVKLAVDGSWQSPAVVLKVMATIYLFVGENEK